MATLTTQLQVRRDTAANLANKVLLIGEPAYATDTKKFSIGDGTTVFSELKDYGFIPSEADTLQTVTTRGNTTTNIIKIQNGAASGAFVLGADVNAETLTVNQRKLGRMGVPSYDSNGTKTIAGISFDSQPTVNYADFGGHPNNTASIAPDVIRFIVANSHDNAVNGARTLALQISKQDGLVDTAGGETSVAAAKFFIPVQATSTITGNEGFIHGGLTAATGKTKNDYILLAGGSTKPISDFALATDVSDFVTKSTDQTITGIKTFVGQSIIKSSAATGSADNSVNGFKFLNSAGNYVGKIASNDAGAIGFYGKTALYFRPVIGSDGKVDTTYGVTMDNTGLYPESTKMNLGTSAKPWGSVYGTTIYENGTSLATKYAAKGHNHDDIYLGKTTYEWNKEFAAGGNGAVSLGRYNLYDTQLTFDITTTTSFTLSGKLVIASQNGKILKATIYGDASNTLTGYLTIYQSAITNNRSYVEVFCNFPGWSKNKVHIYGVALNSATVTNQMTSVTFTNGVPSGVTSGDAKWTGTIVNDITTNCAATNHTHDVNIAISTGTNELTLAYGTKYALTAGGQSFIFTMPTDSDTTYGADRGISLKDSKFGHSNTAITAVTTAGLYKIKYDTYGHITGTESFTLPTVNNGTLTIQRNGTTVATFTANQAGNTTANITDSDTLNTTGSTNDESKLYLVGAKSQAASAQTFSDAQVYTEAGELNATSICVAEQATFQYNSADDCIELVFA